MPSVGEVKKEEPQKKRHYLIYGLVFVIFVLLVIIIVLTWFYFSKWNQVPKEMLYLDEYKNIVTDPDGDRIEVDDSNSEQIKEAIEVDVKEHNGGSVHNLGEYKAELKPEIQNSEQIEIEEEIIVDDEKHIRDSVKNLENIRDENKSLKERDDFNQKSTQIVNPFQKREHDQKPSVDLVPKTVENTNVGQNQGKKINAERMIVNPLWGIIETGNQKFTDMTKIGKNPMFEMENRRKHNRDEQKIMDIYENNLKKVLLRILHAHGISEEDQNNLFQYTCFLYYLKPKLTSGDVARLEYIAIHLLKFEDIKNYLNNTREQINYPPGYEPINKKENQHTVIYQDPRPKTTQ